MLRTGWATRPALFIAAYSVQSTIWRSLQPQHPTITSLCSGLTRRPKHPRPRSDTDLRYLTQPASCDPFWLIARLEAFHHVSRMIGKCVHSCEVDELTCGHKCLVIQKNAAVPYFRISIQRSLARIEVPTSPGVTSTRTPRHLEKIKIFHTSCTIRRFPRLRDRVMH